MQGCCAEESPSPAALSLCLCLHHGPCLPHGPGLLGPALARGGPYRGRRGREPLAQGAQQASAGSCCAALCGMLRLDASLALRWPTYTMIDKSRTVIAGGKISICWCTSSPGHTYAAQD